MRIALTLAMLVLALPTYAAGHAVQIKGMKFNPAKLEVAVGDTITFTNADSYTILLRRWTAPSTPDGLRRARAPG